MWFCKVISLHTYMIHAQCIVQKVDGPINRDCVTMYVQIILKTINEEYMMMQIIIINKFSGLYCSHCDTFDVRAAFD